MYKKRKILKTHKEKGLKLMYYWNVLGLENKKEKITRKMVKEKYQEIKKFYHEKN